MKPSLCIGMFLLLAGSAASPAWAEAVPLSVAATLDAYKQDVARHIYRASKPQVFEEPARPLLKSVIVMSIAIDAKGIARASVIRSNGMRDLEKVAMLSIKRASPLPRWQHARAGVSYYETWLFRDDNRFQIRSIAPLQLTQ